LVDIVEVISNVIEVFQQTEGVDIQLFGIEHFTIQLDKDQMIRVFNNLIKNAIQAISEEQRGLILVRIKVESEKLHIEIEDNGVGISEEERTKIFTPYFTTKSTGSGIGLAMVKQII